MWQTKKAVLLLGTGLMMIPQLAWGKTIGTVQASALNVRGSATVSAPIIQKVYAKESLEIVDLVGGNDPWYKVMLNGKQGYVKREYVALSKADGTVTASSLNIRSYPDLKNSKVIGRLPKGTKVDVRYKVGDFYKVMIGASAGFVASEYIDCQYDAYVMKQSIKNVGTIPVWTGSGSTVPTTSKGDKIVETAMKYLGNPYVYGGTSLTNGTDCSGFTQGVMKLNGISIPRTSSAQSRFGTQVSRAELKKGDLLFFGTSSQAISHCGIYIGDGKMIHASTPQTGIIIAGAYASGGLNLQVIRRVW